MNAPADELDYEIMVAIIGDNPIEYNEDGKRRAKRFKTAIQKYVNERVVAELQGLLHHTNKVKVPWASYKQEMIQFYVIERRINELKTGGDDERNLRNNIEDKIKKDIAHEKTGYLQEVEQQRAKKRYSERKPLVIGTCNWCGRYIYDSIHQRCVAAKAKSILK